MYTSIFRQLGKKKTLYKDKTATRFEKGDFVVFEKKTYKIVNREYHFMEGEDHIHYDVGHIPKGTGFMRKIHEFVVYILSLINKV